MEKSRTAPFYTIPPRHIVSVEHPAIIHDVDKAVDTLQGNPGISKILNPPKADTPANLLLRPEDAMSRPLQSTSSPANNILLKVTVPRRTGRRRKRGTDKPFTDDPGAGAGADPGPGVGNAGCPRPNANDLRQSLEDNLGKYEVEMMGMVNRTHVFRGMPDFVFSTAASPFTNRFRDQILSFDYDKMKQFDISMDKGAISNVDVIPPPSFSHGDLPFNYLYRQNPTVKQSIDTSGQVTTINTSQATKVLTHLVPYDVPAIPDHPRESCPPIHTLEKILQETITVLHSLFTTRPAWTRRGLRNSLTTLEQRNALRHAIPYVGYIFRSGPWRDAIVKLGHDPRSSPDYRIYQTVMFRILPRDPEVARDGGGGRRHALPRAPEVPTVNPFNTSTTTTTTLDGTISTNTPVRTETTHIFTGRSPLSRDGRMWMFCDITDPTLRSLLFPTPAPIPQGTKTDFIRQTCEPVSDGWFGTGTLAKVKTIMRAKIQILTDDHSAPGGQEEEDFSRILATIPDHVDEDNLTEDLARRFTLDAEVASSRELQLATDIRAVVRSAVSARGLAGGQTYPAGGGGGGGGEKEGKGVGAGDKQVRWENEEDGSEGEEAAMEHEHEHENEVDEGDEDDEDMDTR